MNRVAVAQELVKLAKELVALEPEPYAVITVGSKRVQFRITPDAVTGAEPYGSNPMKAVERVFRLVRSHKVDEANVEIITE